MATPQQMINLQANEAKGFYRVMNFLEDEAQYRLANQAEFVAGNPQAFGFYSKLIFLVGSAKIELQLYYDQIRALAAYGGLTPPDSFTLGSQEPAALTRVMATKNVLTVAQLQSGFTDESFLRTGSVKLKLNDVLNASLDDIIVWVGRLRYWQGEWAAITGGGAAVQAMIAILGETEGTWLNGLREIVNDVVGYANQEGCGLTEIEVRRFFFRAFFKPTGSIGLLNRGSEPAGGPIPDEFDPDINVGRDLGSCVQ